MRHLEAKFSNWEPVLERSVTSSTLTLTFRLAYFHFAKLPFPPLARKYTTGTEDGVGVRGRFSPNGSSPAASHRPSNHFPPKIKIKKKKTQ